MKICRSGSGSGRWGPPEQKFCIVTVFILLNVHFFVIVLQHIISARRMSLPIHKLAPSPCLKTRRYVASSGIIFIQNLLKISQFVQKFNGDMRQYNGLIREANFYSESNRRWKHMNKRQRFIIFCRSKDLVETGVSCIYHVLFRTETIIYRGSKLEKLRPTTSFGINTK
jgi:hypothetical protein